MSLVYQSGLDSHVCNECLSTVNVEVKPAAEFCSRVVLQFRV